MNKGKYRFREPVLAILQSARSPVPHREIAHKILGSHRDQAVSKKKKIYTQNAEKVLERELRELVKHKLVDRLPGNFFRLRPPKIKAAPEESEDKPERKPIHPKAPRPELPRRQEEPARPARASSKFERPPSLIIKNRVNEKTEARPARGSQAKGLEGVVSKNSRGFAFVKLSNPPPSITDDVFLAPDEAENLMTGDKVAIAIDTSRRSEKGPAGRLLKILERGMQQAVGAYTPGDFMGPSVLISNKDNELRVFVDHEPAFRNLKEGAAVMVEITHHPVGRGGARGRITAVLADSLDSTTDDMVIITKHKLRSFFSEEVVAASAAVPQTISDKDIAGRKDLRSHPFVTIDGADARDFDDAVCAKPHGNGFRLWVAIADVAHYVTPGSPLDIEAYERGTSVYFPHRVLPMLPERLSNGICSLNPHEDRMAMVCEMDFDQDGNKTNHKVYEAVFQSQKRCVYEVLQEYYDNPQKESANYPEKVRESLHALFNLYKLVQTKRFARGAIDLELPESKVVIGKKGEVLEIKRVERKDTHRLIEEFMIAANEAVSEIMEENTLPFIFRVHETPEPEAFGRFLEVANSFAIPIPVGKGKKGEQIITPQFYQEIAQTIKDSPSARVLHFQLLRSMKQAFYSHENLKHFGLASQAYSHFTSPIRRYPDLIVHRLLKAYIRSDKKLAQTAQGGIAEDLATAAQHCSLRERAATDAEREMIRMKQVRFAEAHLGSEFSGTICGTNQRGIFVELEEVSLEGFVPMDRLGPGAEFNERTMTVRLGKGGKTLRLGDPIRVLIAKTNPQLLQIELEPTADFYSAKAEKKRKIQS